MKSISPLVTVIMPVYNRQDYVKEAIDSIINQSYQNWELLVLNDNSTDRTLEIINTYSDTRIKIISHDSNQGISFNRNLGIELSTGDYIAFLDSDDIAAPNRIEVQLNFLIKNPNFVIVGSNIQAIDKNGTTIDSVTRYTLKAEEIPLRLLFNNYFTTSAVMLNKALIYNEKFSSEYIVAEDYHFWIRIISKHKGWNLPLTLTFYRCHDTNISNQKEKLMIEADHKILALQLNKIGSFLNEEVNIYYHIGKNQLNLYSGQIIKLDSALSKLLLNNKNSKIYDQRLLTNYLYNYWLEIYPTIKEFNISLLIFMLNSSFFKKKNWREKFKLIFKCLIRWQSKA